MAGDKFSYYTVGHSFHRFMNPLDIDKLMELGWACGLEPREDGPETGRLLAHLNLGQFPGAHLRAKHSGCCRTVLDVGCGKGGISYLFAENFLARCYGVDLSEGEIKQALLRKNLSPRGEMTEFVLCDGKVHMNSLRESGALFDVALCLGATFIFGNAEATIDAMLPCLKPDGHLAIGEVTLRDYPGAEQFAFDAARTGFLIRRDTEILDMAKERGLDITYVFEATATNWDRYESLQWTAFHQNLRENPGDLKAHEFFRRISDSKRGYFEKERKYLGWKVFVMRRWPV